MVAPATGSSGFFLSLEELGYCDNEKKLGHPRICQKSMESKSGRRPQATFVFKIVPCLADAQSWTFLELPMQWTRCSKIVWVLANNFNTTGPKKKSTFRKICPKDTGPVLTCMLVTFLLSFEFFVLNRILLGKTESIIWRESDPGTRGCSIECLGPYIEYSGWLHPDKSYLLIFTTFSETHLKMKRNTC